MPGDWRFYTTHVNVDLLGSREPLCLCLQRLWWRLWNLNKNTKKSSIHYI